MGPEAYRIIHIEDDDVDARILKDVLHATGRNVTLVHCTTLEEGLRALRADPFDVALVDLNLPDSVGVQILSEVRSAASSVPVIAVTGSSDHARTESFIELGADDYLFKEEMTPSMLWKSIVYAISNKNYQEKLQRQAQDLILASELERRANSSKTEFIAKVSHELRTPLGVILGYAEMLEKRNDLPADVIPYLTRIKKNGQSLSGLVNDLLDLSRIESGHLEPVLKEVDLLSEVEDLASNFAFHAREKGLSFSCRFLSGVGRTGLTDELRFRQILNNLLTNAMKFTEKGSVSVSVSAVLNDRDQSVVVDVEDTGPGISEAERQKIFEPFQQGEHRSRQRFDGAGIGLALSSRLAAALGGSITLEKTAVGLGSTFRLTIPFRCPESGWDFIEDPEASRAMTSHADGEDLALPQWNGASVLLAEDHPDNQILVGHYLKKLGFHVTVVGDGREAVEAANARHFDVVLMDMQMPVMTGYEAVTKLRFGGYSRPIIALTAFAMDSERNKCFEVGCDGYVGKPLTMKTLADGIHNVFPASEQEQEQEPADVSHLLFDRDPELRKIRDQFLSNLPRYLKDIKLAVLDSDWDRLARDAHRLRGSSASFGIRDVSRACGVLESQAKGARSADVVAATVHQLNLAYRKLVDHESRV